MNLLTADDVKINMCAEKDSRYKLSGDNLSHLRFTVTDFILDEDKADCLLRAKGAEIHFPPFPWVENLEIHIFGWKRCLKSISRYQVTNSGCLTQLLTRAKAVPLPDLTTVVEEHGTLSGCWVDMDIYIGLMRDTSSRFAIRYGVALTAEYQVKHSHFDLHLKFINAKWQAFADHTDIEEENRWDMWE
ncbi:hypothetical protein JW859_09980 [bacterium]|nr:hypothetical protein [bacterium]